MRVWLRLCLALAFLVEIRIIAPAAEPAFNVVQSGAQIRDVVLAPETGVAYFAAYDRGQVWMVDLRTYERQSFAVVGSGPVSLALSPGQDVLGCVNRLDHTVSLLRADDLQLIATVPCGDGASDVAALSSGAFVVVNSFDDSVTVVDPARPDAPVTISGVGGVPSAVASIGNRAVVAVQAPPALVVVEHGAITRTIPLPEPAKAIAAIGAESMVIATARELARVDLVSGNISAFMPGEFLDVTAQNSTTIVALSGQEVLILETNLQPRETISLSQPGRTVAARDGVVLVASSALKSWQVAGNIPPAPLKGVEEEPVAPPAPPAEAAVAGAPLAPEPGPVIAEAEPIVAAPPLAQESEVQTPAPVVPEPGPPAQPPRAAVRQPGPIPSTAFEVRAPSTSRRPSPIPSYDESELTLTEGLQTPEFGAGEGGFQPPDWTKPFENMEAERIEVMREGDQERILWQGNVRLQLEDTLFKSQSFQYNEQTGEVLAEGDVHVTQGLSQLEADRVQYFVRPQEELEPLSPLRSAIADDQAQERRRLTLGRVTAEKIHVLEPTREIDAQHIDYDFATETGELVDVRGRAGIYYFGADRLRMLGPEGADAEDIWVTTCDLPTPHYRIRLSQASMREGEMLSGSNVRLQLGKANTPLYWPKWSLGLGPGLGLGFDFDSGRSAELGYYLNVAQWIPVTPDLNIGLRFFPTEKEGIGFGIDSEYDYLQDPESPLFRAKGSVESLYTTKDRGLIHWYNRYDLWQDAVMLNQVEHWTDQAVFKDYYYDRYRNRSEPRTFTNITYTRPSYIATGTARVSTGNWVRETNRLPEVTYHLLERPLMENLYVTYDTILGYNERNPAGTHAARFVNVGRLTLDLDLHEAFSVTPFLEAEATWYSDEREGDGSITRVSTMTGVTAQSRFHRTFPGRWGFSEFKHVVLPSVTLSYRPEPTVELDETPRFDAYDNVYGRTRLESKIDNIFLGRDAESGETWQVARLTLYQGNDLWNEFRKSDDYEVELDIRPRPWWGFQAAAERHNIQHDYDLDRPFFFERLALELYEDIAGHPLNPEAAYQYNAQYGDYNRILSFLYYDGTPLNRNYNGRIGFAYTATQEDVFNRELLYGVGYRLNENWGVAFEHRYDFDREELTRQTYELRRALHCWEMALQFRDRESGWDIGVEFNIRAFPGSKLKF